jgi:preprotein translocase subunit SecG
MSTFFTILVIFHVVVCLFLILLVMLQNDKGGGLAGAFGGMGGGAAFSGSSAATFLTTLTWWLALAFFLIIIALGAIGTQRSASRLGDSELKGSKWISNALQDGKPAAGGIPGLGGSEEAPKAIPGLPVQPEKTP